MYMFWGTISKSKKYISTSVYTIFNCKCTVKISSTQVALQAQKWNLGSPHVHIQEALVWYITIIYWKTKTSIQLKCFEHSFHIFLIAQRTEVLHMSFDKRHWSKDLAWKGWPWLKVQQLTYLLDWPLLEPSWQPNYHAYQPPAQKVLHKCGLPRSCKIHTGSRSTALLRQFPSIETCGWSFASKQWWSAWSSSSVFKSEIIFETKSK